MNDAPVVQSSVAITIIGGLLLILIRSGLLNVILKRLLGGIKSGSPVAPSLPSLPVLPDVFSGEDGSILQKWLERRKTRRERRKLEELGEIEEDKIILEHLEKQP